MKRPGHGLSTATLNSATEKEKQLILEIQETGRN